MRAAVLHGVGDLRIEQVPEPEPNDANVIVKVVKASICNGSDGAIYQGKRDFEQTYADIYSWKLPAVWGHECTGSLVHVGKAIEDLAVGDRVTSWSTWGAFAEYHELYPQRLVVQKLSACISPDEGSVMELLGSTMYIAAEVEIGQVVVVFGLGPTGLLLAQEARLSGAVEVVGIDRHQNRLEKAIELGVDRVIDVRREDPVEVVRRSYGSCDVVIDATGANVIDSAVKMIRTKGKYLVYGCSDGSVTFDAGAAFYKGIDFVGVKSPSRVRVADLMRRGEQLVARGQLKIAPLITHHLPLEEVREGVEMCCAHPEKCIKIVIDVQ